MKNRPGKIKVRESITDDIGGLETLYPAAFPDEDLVPLVLELLQRPGDVLSLVGWVADELAGHVLFTHCAVTDNSVRAVLLGPLAVSPDRQKQGIGTALVRAGIERAKQAGVDVVCVLGDPAYYSRFGFTPEHSVQPPYALADEWQSAWQSLRPGAMPCVFPGKLSVPRPWDRPELWAP